MLGLPVLRGQQGNSGGRTGLNGLAIALSPNKPRWTHETLNRKNCKRDNSDGRLRILATSQQRVDRSTAFGWQGPAVQARMGNPAHRAGGPAFILPRAFAKNSRVL